MFGAGSSAEHRVQRVTSDKLKKSKDELSAVEQITRLAMFRQNQQFQLAVREHQRLARDVVSEAVLDSSARFERH